MRLISDQQVEELIRLARLRAVDDRLTDYSQEQAQETVDALSELITHRRGVPLEGAIRDGKIEAA